MNRRRQILFLALIVAFAGTIAVAMRLFAPSTPLLLQRATKVSDVQEDTAYCWLSSRELLVVTNTSSPRDPWARWSGYVETIDPQTGQRSCMEGLTAAITRHAIHYNALHGPMMFSLSPDGKWLRWSCFTPAGTSGPGGFMVTAGKDGSGYHEWPLPSFSLYHWFDGHRWGGPVSSSKSSSGLGQGSLTDIIVHDPAHPAADRLLSAKSPEAKKMSSLMAAPSPGKQSATLAAVSEDKQSSVEISILNTPAGAAPGTLPSIQDKLIYPSGSWLTTEQTNPQQTRILLYVHELDISFWVNFVRKLLPLYGYKPHPFEHLCIYRADTREVVEMGRIPYETPSHEDEQTMRFRWLPDGKHIQFYYQNAVYLVSTD